MNGDDSRTDIFNSKRELVAESVVNRHVVFLKLHGQIDSAPERARKSHIGMPRRHEQPDIFTVEQRLKPVVLPEFGRIEPEARTGVCERENIDRIAAVVAQTGVVEHSTLAVHAYEHTLCVRYLFHPTNELMPAEQGLDAEPVRVSSEPGHGAAAYGGNDRTVTEFLAGLHIAHMNFNDGCRNGSDCIGDGIGIMGIGTGIEHYADAVGVEAGGMESVDKLALAVMLLVTQIYLGKTDSETFEDCFESLGPVDAGFALSEQIEVGSVEDEDVFHFMCTFSVGGSSLLRRSTASTTSWAR